MKETPIPRGELCGKYCITAEKPMIRFCKAYISSMRLYYSFITGIAGWLGVAYYEYLAVNPSEHTSEVLPTHKKKLVILILLF